MRASMATSVAQEEYHSPLHILTPHLTLQVRREAL